MLGNINDTGGMDDVDLIALRVLKQWAQALYISYIPLNVGNTLQRRRCFTRQNKPAHRRPFFLEHAHDGAAQMSVGPGHDI